MSGKTFRQDKQIKKIFYNQTKIKKVFRGPDNVFSSGYIVTYHIDTSNIVSKEVDDGADCIAEAPTAAKSGWTFVGWREDSAANANVLPSRTCDQENINLYAVFKQVITVSLLGGNTTLTNTGVKYYNNGNVANPSITLSSATLSGYTLVGYRNDTTASATVTYTAGSSYTFASNTTIYAVFKQTITVSLVGGTTTLTNTGTRYYNNGSELNPSITLSASTLSGYTLVGYRNDTVASSDVNYTANTAYVFSANKTIYAVFQQTITLSYDGNGSTGGYTNSQTGTRYYNNGNENNPSFILSSNGYTKTNYRFIIWAMGSTSGTQYPEGAVVWLSSNTSFYALWEVVLPAALPPFISDTWSVYMNNLHPSGDTCTINSNWIDYQSVGFPQGGTRGIVSMTYTFNSEGATSLILNGTYRPSGYIGSEYGTGTDSLEVSIKKSSDVNPQQLFYQAFTETSSTDIPLTCSTVLDPSSTYILNVTATASGGLYDEYGHNAIMKGTINSIIFS